MQDFRDAETAHNDESGMNAASAKMERLSDAESDALHLLMQTPAPDAAALRWKLDYFSPKGEFESWSPDFMRQTIEDIARILGPAG